MLDQEKLPEKIPTINVGRYKGVKIDQLPTSYLRWMLTQKFPAEWVEIARRKVEASPYSDDPLSISRHAIDQFSLRHLNLWITREEQFKAWGLGTFITKMAEDAWSLGKDVSKNRHQDDGVIKLYKDIRFVFNQNPAFPEYKDLITVM